MTTRERREARAERLRGWANKRNEKAAAGFLRADQYRGDTAFWTQPGRIIERERVYAAGERAMQDSNKADEMNSRAAGIEQQLDRAIYSDDPNAIDALESRIATLEAEQAALKLANAEFRKAHKAELAAMNSYERDCALPAAGWHLSNLSANIRRNKQRLESIKAQSTSTKPQRIIQAHRTGECARCGEAVSIGDYIGKYLDGWVLLRANGNTWEPACA